MANDHRCTTDVKERLSCIDAPFGHGWVPKGAQDLNSGNPLSDRIHLNARLGLSDVL
jgi:hypothetical protein